MTEHLQKFLEQCAGEDRKKLLNLIPFFHGFFARTKNPTALEIAKDLGIAANKLKPTV